MQQVISGMARSVLVRWPFACGQGRLVDSTFLSQLRFVAHEMDVKCRGGFSMTVRPNELIGRHLYLTGQFDSVVVEVLASFARQDTGEIVLLDIGSNIGYVSCAMLARFPGLRSVAIEPVPATFAILRRNLERFEGRGHAINAALSDHCGNGKMVVNDANSGASRLVEDEGALEVDCIDGASLCSLAQLDALHLVKIDVEGHEVPVLRTLEPLVTRHRPRAILFEHDGNPASPSSPLYGVFNRVRYRVMGVSKSLLGWKLVPLQPAGHLPLP